MKRLLTVLLVGLLISAGNASETPYNKLIKTLETKYQIKYQRKFEPKLRFYDETINGYTFEGNEDYEIYIDAMRTQLEEPLRETQWYETFQSGFVCGTAVTILIMFAVR